MDYDEIPRLFSSQPPPPLFIYLITPDQVDTATGTDKPITLNIGIYNPKANGFVKCDSIQLGISIGTGARELTSDQADVKGQSSQKEWNIQKLPYVSSPLVFKITPATGTTGLNPGESINFKLTGINVNNTEGAAPVYIGEQSDTTRLSQVLINKASPNLQIVYFQAAPSSIQPGQASFLSWATTGASRCTIEPLSNSICPDNPPPDELPPNGHIQVCPKQNPTIYTLTAYSHGGGYRKFPAPVYVNAVQILQFTATPATVNALAPTSRLKWNVLNARTLTLDPGDIDVTGKDFYDVDPQTATSYTLTAGGEGALDTKVANVYITPPSITQFTPAPTEFVRGQPVTLAWATEHATSCAIDQGVGPVQTAAAGSVAVMPREQTTYTLTASGLGQAATKPLTLTPQASGWRQVATANTSPPTVVGLSFKGRLWLIDTQQQRVVSSPDGSNWATATSTLPLAQRANSAALVFDDGSGEKMWIMGGLWARDDHNRGLYNDVWSSPDGVNWTQVRTNKVWPARAWHRALVFQGKMWIIGGIISVSAPPYVSNDVWSSPDGVNWTQATASAQWSPRLEFGAAVFQPVSSPATKQIWICGGADTHNNSLAEAWHTNDGATWVKSAAPWTARDRCGLLMLNDKLYLLGGIGNMNVLTDMWTMDAQMQWSQLPERMPYNGQDLYYWGIATGVFNWRAWLVYAAENQPVYFYTP